MGDYCDIEIIGFTTTYKVDVSRDGVIHGRTYCQNPRTRFENSWDLLSRWNNRRAQTGMKSVCTTIRAGDVVGEHTIWFCDRVNGSRISPLSLSHDFCEQCGATLTGGWCKNRKDYLTDVLSLNALWHPPCLKAGDLAPQQAVGYSRWVSTADLY